MIRRPPRSTPFPYTALSRSNAIRHLMAELGIVAADIGLPGAGPRAVAQVRALATEIRDAGLPIAPNCAARTVIADVEPRSEDHTSELHSHLNPVCRPLLAKK